MGRGAAATERESIARGKMKDIICFLREKRAQMVGEREKNELSKSKPNVQLKYEDARDCGIRR